MPKSKVLFVLSGSIAAYKACQVISRLVQDGHDVQSVATPSALKFVGAATLEGLTGKPVLSDLWENGRAMDHIHLSRWADFGVLCPATANTVNRVAAGLGEDLVGNLLLAWPKGKPLHIFPAMNAEMLNDITQENLARLSARGFTVHETGAGNLACGEEGSGRLLEPEEILARLATKSLGRILITAGATREPVDGIRFISNVSTGRTGAHLADRLSARGWEVTYLHGAGAIQSTAAGERISFSSFSDLDENLRAQLGRRDFRAVIHAAAVSDYSVAEVNDGPAAAHAKIASGEDLEIKLRPNFKILARLKEYARDKNTKIVGFKLTLNKPPAETAKIARGLLGKDVDAVVANDWSGVQADRENHPGLLISKDDEKPFRGIETLADFLHELLQENK